MISLQNICAILQFFGRLILLPLQIINIKALWWAVWLNVFEHLLGSEMVQVCSSHWNGDDSGHLCEFMYKFINSNEHNESLTCERFKYQKDRRRPDSCHPFHPEVQLATLPVYKRAYISMSVCLRCMFVHICMIVCIWITHPPFWNMANVGQQLAHWILMTRVSMSWV